MEAELEEESQWGKRKKYLSMCPDAGLGVAMRFLNVDCIRREMGPW